MKTQNWKLHLIKSKLDVLSSKTWANEKFYMARTQFLIGIQAISCTIRDDNLI